MKRIFQSSFCLLLFAVLWGEPARADRISSIVETDFFEQSWRFFSFQDPFLRCALGGAVLLGISCGLLGTFLVVRKMALMGDALSHAVLPGVAAGFLWNMDKDPLAIFIGAVIAGVGGSLVVQAITKTTKLKEDAALGMVLASFFAVGVCLMTMIQDLPQASKSGLDSYLFGQASALSIEDVTLMGITTTVTVVMIFVFYHGLLAASFDSGFSRTVGLPTELLHYMLLLLLAFSVVVALQAVGVVLVSAMLITPAAAAYLLTDRFYRMLILSAFFGMMSGALGAFLSFTFRGFPTGPLMVLSASCVFVLAFAFGPRHGVISRWWRHRSRSLKIQRENTLKAVYHLMEENDFKEEGVSMEDLAQRRRASFEDLQYQVRLLQNSSMADFEPRGEMLYLTPEGWRHACRIVRNHRLWELYLTAAADYPADHVHDDAEEIEHVLGEKLVRELERRLEYPQTDPHGKRIPSLPDLHRYQPSEGKFSPSYFKW